MEFAVARGVDRLDFVVGREPVAEAAGILDQLRHASPAIELFKNFNDGLAFGFRLRKTHGVPQLILGNIDGGLHASILDEYGIQINVSENPSSGGYRGWRMVQEPDRPPQSSAFSDGRLDSARAAQVADEPSL